MVHLLYQTKQTYAMEKEILFTVQSSPSGGFTATAEAEALSTKGATIEEVKLNAWDVVICKFEGQTMPSIAFSGA